MVSGSVATLTSVIRNSSQVILVPLSSDVILTVAVVVTNVVFDSASTIVTTNGPRVEAEFPETTILLSPSYLQRAATKPAAEALQVKVTVVPLHTSGPASLDRPTAAETEGMTRASILYVYRTST